MHYVIGDIHNNLKKLKQILKQINITRDDELIVLGDVFDRGGETADPFGVYCALAGLQGKCSWIRGNHDDWLANYTYEYFNTPEKKRHKLAPYGYNSFELLRQRITEVDMRNIADLIKGLPLQKELELEGKKYLCFGGTESPDKEEREAGYNWWPQEMPSDEEYAACETNLEANGWQVDYVLTHDAPSRFLDFTSLAVGESNRLHLFLDKVLLKLTYEKWFFGCYHKDVALSTKSRCVFCDVIPMGERHAKR